MWEAAELMGYSGWQAAAAAAAGAGGPTLTFRARINGQPGPRPGSRRVHLQRKVCEESAATNSQATSWSIYSSLIVGKATRVGVFFGTVTTPVKLWFHRERRWREVYFCKREMWNGGKANFHFWARRRKTDWGWIWKKENWAFFLRRIFLGRQIRWNFLATLVALHFAPVSK